MQREMKAHTEEVYTWRDRHSDPHGENWEYARRYRGIETYVRVIKVIT